jgi:hypothetical protein
MELTTGGTEGGKTDAFSRFDALVKYSVALPPTAFRIITPRS